MDTNFFNRLLHLINARPKQGKRLIGIGLVALWELWQRIEARIESEKKERGNAPERKGFVA